MPVGLLKITLLLMTAALLNVVFMTYLTLFFRKKAALRQSLVVLIFLFNLGLTFATTMLQLPIYLNDLVIFVGWSLFLMLFQGKVFLKGLSTVLFFSVEATLEILIRFMLYQNKAEFRDVQLDIYVKVINVLILAVLVVIGKLIFRRQLGHYQSRNLYGLLFLPISNLVILASVFGGHYYQRRWLLYLVVVIVLLNTFVSYYLVSEIDKSIAESEKNQVIEAQLSHIKIQNTQLANQYQLMFDLIHSENSFFLNIDQEKITKAELVQAVEQRLLKVNAVLVKLDKPDKISGIQTVMDYFVRDAQNRQVEVVLNQDTSGSSYQDVASVDIMAILIILLSNAVKQSVRAKYPFMGINYIQNEYGTIYTITNSFVRRQKIGKYDVSSLQRYGLDLQQVAKRVAELHGEFRISTESDFFKAEIVIPTTA
ncbi:GHKL domain-containing protein [Lapidilactobacillus wuchangensis]|uniref:GHKL domain-containing protein n=1 Tax=Lapidilactobacillus wuchangensis TaxID=2486001 RepID=UPI000F78615C|nr:GHKL domain-containing protein [Lapidilactobacillus wuchangensis]